MIKDAKGVAQGKVEIKMPRGLPKEIKGYFFSCVGFVCQVVLQDIPICSLLCSRSLDACFAAFNVGRADLCV